MNKSWDNIMATVGVLFPAAVPRYIEMVIERWGGHCEKIPSSAKFSVGLTGKLLEKVFQGKKNIHKGFII